MKVPDWISNNSIRIFGLTIGLLMIFSILYDKIIPSFQGFKNNNKENNVVLDTSMNNVFPYTTDPINSLDQYELEAVFNNEGDRELKKQQINQMTRRYPLDWANYPPNSSKFQSGQAKYIEGFSSRASAENLEEPYKDIGIGNLTPPDTIAIEQEEKRILASYTPKKANDLTTYDIEDANELLSKIYVPKGLIPEVVRKEGNVFEVVRTRSIKDVIQYEDDLPDAPASSRPIEAAGEARINVPPVALETAAARDPYYEPTTSTRADRSDYMRWTPGLERMFAPTNPTPTWT
jgi:hypothetical protein